MTTPSAFNSVRALIDRAYVNCGLIAAGSQANSQQYADGLNRLNERVNFLQTKGLKLFTNVDTPMALVANAGTYVLGPGASLGVAMTKPMRVPLAYFLDVSGNKVPLTPISWQELSILQTANQFGTPVNYFVDKQETQLNITLWPTPDSTAATGSVHLILQTQVGQGVLLTDAISFPQEWFNGLSWDLADELATGQPAAIVLRCAMKAKEFIEALEGWDVEDAQTFLTVDPRMTYGSSDFA
ncbi:hypothetical protein UFOVP2_40 [uncultured Caudovirales phage]|uniref:Uncharacterized protein n=1 Tax=uncultured Caudovirales phage TaxID=2100421 RepID=A0A6J5KI93_9CAUD|nr:hypothetical protein UFOVP2_40 [uncultured Caudovirales phage]